jgi:hypothetical protein
MVGTAKQDAEVQVLMELHYMQDQEPQLKLKDPDYYKIPVLGIWIRMFLGLPDPYPDPFVRGIDPDPSLFS